MMTRTLAILFLAASPLLTEAAGTCRAKTEVEAKAARRKAAGCTGTAPTGGQCSCSGNGRGNATKDCEAPSATGWASTGKKCVTARPDKNAAWDKHDWAYPADYWNYCPPTDASRAGSPATSLNHWPEAGSWHCTQVSAAGVTHSFTPGNAGYNSSHNAQDWCTKRAATWTHVLVTRMTLQQALGSKELQAQRCTTPIRSVARLTPSHKQHAPHIRQRTLAPNN